MSATDWNGLDGHEALVSELRANPPVAPERLRQRVLELGSVSRSRRAALPRSRRGRALAVVLVAAAIAVGAALVHGFVSSGSHSAANEALDGVVARPDTIAHTALKGSGSTSTVVQAGTARVLKPNAFGAYKGAAGNSGQALNLDNLPAAELLTIPKDRLVHADASLQVHVGGHSALTTATNKATQIISSLGGYAQSVQYQSETKGGGSSFLALKVPVGKAQTAIGRLAQLGTLVSQQVSTQDLQQQLTRQTNGIGALRRAIAVYEQALKSGSLSPSQRIDVQIKLANARHSVKVLRKARAGTVASGATADISLTLTTSKSSIVGGGSHTSGRFDRLLGGAAGFLALEGIIVLYALVVLSPLLVIGGLAWAFLRERRRRDERRLLAST
jgi:Domain of unknown function (DUF4349)